MIVNYSQDFVTIAMCKDMVAFVTYCVYLKQFCKCLSGLTFCEAVENLCEVHIFKGH